MRTKKDKVIYLLGDFTKAKIKFSGQEEGSASLFVAPEVFSNAIHDVQHNGITYRFMNPDQSDESVDFRLLKTCKDSFAFGENLEGLVVSITSDHRICLSDPEDAIRP